MTKFFKAAAILFLVIFGGLAVSSANVSLFAAPQTAPKESSKSQRTEHSIRTENNDWQWRHSENGIGLEVKIRGHIEFAEDYSDITNIGEGGSILVTDERGGVARKFEAKATSAGIQRSYWVAGASRQFDNEARTWLAKVLDDTVRQGGYDARPRVQRILKQSGPSGVLREITRLKGDYVKGIYFDELINNGNLNDETVRQVLRQAATEIRSDYEKAQLLIKLSEHYLTNEAQRTIYLEGVNTLRSDYEKGRTLGALLKKGTLSNENMMFALRAVRSVSSDYERAQLLIKVTEGSTLDEPSRVAYLDAVATIGSDYEKGRVLAAFLKKGEPQKDSLILAVKSASNIASDYEKAQFLIKVAAVGSTDESVRSALINAARTIRSEHERGRVLSAVFK